MSDASSLFSLSELKANTLDILVYERANIAVDLASILIWLLAIFTVYVGAKKAAEDDREANYYVPEPSHGKSKRGHDKSGIDKGRSAAADDLEYGSLPEAGSHDDEYDASSHGFHDDDEESKAPFASGGYQTGSSSLKDKIGGHSAVVKQPARPRSGSGSINQTRSSNNGGDNIDITFGQAICFVMISSCFLLLLYFVDLYAVVSVVYLVSAAVAISFISLEPIFRCLLGRSDSPDNICSPCESANGCCGIVFDCALVLALICGSGLAIVWYVYRADTDFVWFIQDALGMNVCILFLQSIRLPNLRVASTLLLLAFCYDVFFVFISPLIFDSSVMLSVAEGGSSSTG
jgi:hypothetical protein